MVHRREQVLHTGVLFKRGSGTDYPFGRTNWKTRYFVLTPSTLAYYMYEGGQWKGEVDFTSPPPRKTVKRSATDAEKQASSPLRTTIEVMPADSKKTGRSKSTIWRIAVNTPERRLLLAASSEWEMNVWVEKLQLALQLSRSNDPLDREQLFHRMSLPGLAGTSNTFVTDFQTVNSQRRRQSIAAATAATGNSTTMMEWSQQPELWEFPLTETTLQLTRTPSASSVSASSSVQSPQDPGAFDDVLSNEYYGETTFEYPDSIPIMGTMTPPPSSSTPIVPMHEHTRLSLPSSIESQLFSNGGGDRRRTNYDNNSVLSTQPAMPLIVDFQNFARSRRRQSIDSSARYRSNYMMPTHEQRSVDVFRASTAYRGRTPVEYPFEVEEEKENDDAEDTTARADESSRRATELAARKRDNDETRKAMRRVSEPIAQTSDTQQRPRFARLRQWLSFKRERAEA